MKVLLIEILKFFLRIIYAPIKLFKTKDRIVYLSRQSNDKSLDMRLLEKEIDKQCPNTEQVFRLKMIPESLGGKISYCFSVIGDMYYLATSKVAILDTYSITVSCLKHKKSLKVIQMWHALGALKKFGLQSVGTKEGRDEKISRAMCMHKNYDYVLSPSKKTAKFYMEAFGCDNSKIKICSLPRVDDILTDNNAASRFFTENPGLSHDKIVLYLPTFRERDAYIAEQLKVEFRDVDGYRLIISAHPLFSKIKIENEFSYSGDFSTYDLMKIADVIITDYSACAFEASVLMKPLYIFVPDYDEYSSERGINVDLKKEMPSATFENAEELERKTEIWAKNHVFKYRWFYFADKKLLGIYAVPTSVYHLFDSTLQFQNSCDQDYDYDYWNDIPLFKSIADKYRYMSNDEMIKEYEKRRNEKWVSEDSVSEYYIKTFIYDDIWDMIENTLYNDKEILHISLLGEYDYFITEKFFKETVKAVNEYLLI